MDAMNVGIVFCGRQSSGGHNVITGVFDYLQEMNPTNKLYGFIGENPIFHLRVKYF